jgi:hypothetical protein
MGKQLELFSKADVPFVNEVEIFNRTFGKPNNYEPTIPEKKSGNSYTTLYLKNWKNIDRLAKTETSWKFWMLFVILLTLPLATPLCYMVLRIRYGQPIKKYKQVICQNLVQLKKKPWRLSPKEAKNSLSMPL